MLQHLTCAVWSMVIRRLLENLTRPLPLLAVGFVPIAVNLPRIYSWADASQAAADPALARKAAWLDPSFFNMRAAVYLALWAVLAGLLARISARQDQTSDPRANDRMRRMSSWGLPLLALTSSFAGFDWLMSLEPHWASTMFGVYFWAQSLVSSLAALILLALALQRNRLAQEDDHHRAPARPGQAALRLRGLLDVHRLLPVFPDLVRESPRGD